MSSARARKRKATGRRRGATLVWVTVALFAIIGIAVFAVDVGHVFAAQAELQAAVDAAALAGAEGLTIGPDEARARALAYAARNRANGANVTLDSSDIELGMWNPVAREFTPLGGSSAAQPDAVRVSTQLSESRGSAVGTFFARVIGEDTVDVGASAIAFYRSRDILLVLDLSGSMNDDSEFLHIGRLGQSAVETNLQQIYNELGAPVYGNMQFQPVLVPGNDNAQIMSALGLDGVSYPYPSGSWYDYFNYVRTDGDVAAAGYAQHYGGMTLVNYWLERQPMASQTPDLWLTSQQPITAVKDAVSVFFDYIEQVETDDRIGLSVYTAADGTATLESELTDDFSTLRLITRQRQAAHYDRFTNIGAGLAKAVAEVEENGRVGTFKMIVLLTDGKANRPSNQSAGRAYALEQADVAREAGLPVVTISLGADADTSLMGQISNVTGGVHFNVPGGQSVAAYEEDLMDVFREIASHRPLKLVE